MSSKRDATHGPRATRPGRGGAGPGLARDVVVREALGLIDDAGAAALTMRALGARLGVQAMSLYHHVEGRDDLLDGVAELLVEGIPLPAGTAGWEDGARRFATGIRQVALAHPEAFQLVGTRPLSTTAASRAVVPLLSAMHAAGLDPRQSTVVYRLLAAYARGFVLAEIAGLTLADPPVDELPGMDYPAAFAAALSADHTAMFDEGLAVVIDGIRSRFGLTDTTSATAGAAAARASRKRRRARPPGQT